MIKEVDKNFRDTVIDLDGNETEVRFSAKYSYFALMNNGDGNVIMSLLSGKSDTDDGVRIILPGETATIAAPGMSDRIFVLGTGRVQISALTEPTNPFKQGAKGGGNSGGGTSDVTKGYVDAQDSTNLGVAKAYTDTAVNAVKADVSDNADSISSKMDKNNPTGMGTFSLNRMAGSTIGERSFAAGYNNVASGKDSHAEGYSTIASEMGAHTEGGYGIANAYRAHVQGWYTKAEYMDSFAAGQKTLTGRACDTVLGRLNVAKGDSLLTIGYGSGTTRDMNDKPDDVDANEYQRSGDDVVLKNVFRVDTAGTTYGLKAYTTSGADYAEYIKPWFDDNPDNEDRRGYFVTVKNGKLCKAEPGDYIVGITSGNPSVIGNGDEDWLGRWQRDEFNELVYEDVEVDDYEDVTDENGNIVSVNVGSHIEKQTVQNPDYDPTQEYIERKDRPEWSCVGMIGVLPLRDDGTCVAGGFAKCGAGGIATAAEEWDCHKTFFVIERINDHIISVEMR